MKACTHCGAPIRYNQRVKGWLHVNPFGEFRISRREAEDIHSDPPRTEQPLHRPTFIHPAAPERNGYRQLLREDAHAL